MAVTGLLRQKDLSGLVHVPGGFRSSPAPREEGGGGPSPKLHHRAPTQASS
jgi:hypothetical protein